MRLRVLKVKAFSAPAMGDTESLPGLEDEINAWLEGTEYEGDPGRGDAQFEDIQFLIDNGTFYCFITYVDA